MTTDGTIVPYADKAMFEAAPIIDVHRVVLLSMNTDPLGEIASFWKMYKGEPVFNMADITDDERRAAWADMQKTKLVAPLEAVKLHFFLEGVDRSFTHQLVRQRTAVYAQESLRFAVKTGGAPLRTIVPYPPSFDDSRVMANTSGANDMKALWNEAVDVIDKAVSIMIANGVPAEDARGLYPHAILTRVHYVTDLRNLLEHAGNRLCTQAQHHWKKIFQGIREEIGTYWRTLAQSDWRATPDDDHPWTAESEKRAASLYDAWQFELIASEGFVPACYQVGHCPFDAKIDRGCTIRPRVEEFARYGIKSYAWEGDANQVVTAQDGTPLDGIHPSEWLEDAQAGWTR